ncbi:hypothetical protein COCNU_07G005680 [Cocos nucifera]|uniref:Remorin C-terminal domain-containing protein n=1 Tax=Cocos nucifera TaxID=13894 RepID=A0A8K0N4T0_COCNU|nr:hypothetical protein COCNU_07G005680 [Cocos nucifera]
MGSIPPCSSSNKKRLDLHLHHPLRWSNTTTPSDDEESLPSATAAKSSDQMLMMMAMMMGRERGSSFGSCGGGLSNLGSVMDHCPPTPSPVCSPMKLEKRRSKAMGKMQRKLRMTQKKAEKKRLKEQAAAAKKIATVNKAFGKISSTGKLPWMLAFL